MRVILSFFLFVLTSLAAPQPNRFTIQDEFCDLYYPDANYPKLTTPQWIGEEGIDAALVLAIDDMRDTQKYENYLRPILERLKKIDGRAPASIMTCQVNPTDPQLQSWLKEGVSLEAHTIDHPCPILGTNSALATAKSTYDRCVDLMASIEGNNPVAFRTPCMDGINSASPRLFSEIMMRTTPTGRFLTMSSSIGMLLTPDDPEIPKDLVTDKDGKPRYNKYLLPGWINYIKNYPYPWVIGNSIWEVGFCIPDDYEGSRPNGDKSPNTIADMKASIDAVVSKKGLWVMTFHPYNWITNTQVIELIDHTISKHGKRVKFLSLREVQERIDKNLLSGQPLRNKDGGDNGVRLMDLNHDGFLDVVIGNDSLKQTRLWDPRTGQWTDTTFPSQMTGARFGVLQSNGFPSVYLSDEKTSALWNFNGTHWIEIKNGTAGLEINGEKVLTMRNGRDNGVRLRDLDGDGISELIVSNPQQNAIFAWNDANKSWRRMSFALPTGVSIVTENGHDNGVRFVDFNKDGADDLIFSNEKEYGLWLYVAGDFLGFKQGFSREILHGKRGEKPEIPMIVRGGEYPNNSAWFANDMMWVQNEDTGKLPDLVDRVSFKDLLDGLQPQSKSPRASLETLETLPGLQVELVAQEPQVESPVYLDWSADGTMWVVEMRDYPKGINGKGGGAIKRLQDLDGDGIYETSTVFLDNLNYPNGLFPWRNGILISAAPEIIYAEDTNGDGRADKTEVLFTGFVEGNQQHRANGYEWGLDRWLYGANGDSGGRILSKKTGKIASISGRDFRFKPDTGEFEAISGGTQFGRHRDDWGNWFGGANYTWGWHYFLEEKYLTRNPTLAVRGSYKQYATAPNASRVFPISRRQQRFNDVHMAGHVTSGCSFSPYRDDLFGPEFEHSIFTCEPVHNVVHREVLETDGVSFKSHRGTGEETREFLAARDPWFRPVTVKTGPDGAIYIADMYRHVIEHPEWIPQDFQKRVNVRAGEGMGRIYRIRPKDKPLRKIPNLARASEAELITALSSPNGWQRDTAQRLLMNRNGKIIVPEIEKLASAAPSPKVRLQALYTLAGLDSLKPALITAALNDSDAHVREHAIRLAEPSLRDSGKLGEALLDKVNDPDLRVRYQLAFTLGEWRDPRATSALASLASKDATESAMITAVLSSSSREPQNLLELILEQNPANAERLISELLKVVVRSGRGGSNKSISEKLLAGPDYPPWKLNALGVLLNSSGARDAISFDSPGWTQVSETARHTAERSDASESERTAAIQLLARSKNPDADLQLLTRLLNPDQPLSVQRAALRRFEQLDSPATAKSLLASWQQAGPQTRAEIASLLLRREAWTTSLLDQVQSGALQREDLGATVQQELRDHRAKNIRERANKLLAPTTTEKEPLVRDYLTKITNLQGDADHGRALFETHCALCHKAGNLGAGAGPNLAMLYDRGPDQIVTAILDPNRAVEDKYRSYIAELKNGEELTGLLVSETGNSVTMALVNGVEQTLVRSDLRNLAAQKRSLMPEGFEQFLKPQDLADLMKFIQSSAVHPKHFPGNTPQLVHANSEAPLELTAVNAEIYGDTLIFEAGHQNLGFWKTESDRAVWTIESPRLGTYEVWLEWACPDDRQNNEFVFQIEDQRCIGSVEGTGTWDDYKQKKIGALTIPAGTHRAVFRAGKPIKSFLLDLRKIRLVPTETRSARNGLNSKN